MVGPLLADPLGIGNVGEPVATSDLKRAVLQLTYIYGLGALILFFAAASLGRLSVRSARDIAFAQRELDAQAAAADSQRRIADTPGPVEPGSRADSVAGSRPNKPGLHRG